MRGAAWPVCLIMFLSTCGPAVVSAPHVEQVQTEKRPVLVIRPPTADEAFNYTMLIADNVALLRQGGYKFRLPDHPVFQALLSAHAPADEEKNKELEHVFARDIYDESEYAKAVEALAGHSNSIQAALDLLVVLHQNWGYTIFPKHEIIFNFVGLGSFHPLSGKINMCLRKDTAASAGGRSGLVGVPTKSAARSPFIGAILFARKAIESRSRTPPVGRHTRCNPNCLATPSCSSKGRKARRQWGRPIP